MTHLDLSDLRALISAEVRAQLSTPLAELDICKAELLNVSALSAATKADYSEMRSQLHDVVQRYDCIRVQVGALWQVASFERRGGSNVPPGHGASTSHENVPLMSVEHVLAVPSERTFPKGISEALPEEETERPESMFSYCMDRLQWDPWGVSSWAGLFLGVLLLTQAVFLTQINAQSQRVLYVSHMQPPDTNIQKDVCLYTKLPGSDHTPLFDHKLIAGQSWGLLWSGAFACLLVAGAMKLEDDESMRSLHRSAEVSSTTWCIMEAAWFFRTIYSPMCFVVGSVLLIVGSKDSLDTVLNSLAVAYYLDIDNMMYNCFLSPTEKRKYQKSQGCPRHSSQKVSYHAWLFFCVQAPLMVGSFLYLRVAGAKLTGKMYITFQMRWNISFAAPLVVFSRSVMWCLLRWQSNEVSARTWVRTLCGCMSVSLGQYCCAYAMWFLMNNLFGDLLFLTYVHGRQSPWAILQHCYGT